MFISKKATIFKGEKSYLTDNKGEKIVDLGFDKLQFLNGGNLVQYWLGGKTNIVSVDFIKENSKRGAYTSACVWDEVKNFNGFYLLSAKNKDGLKFVDHSGTSQVVKNGYVFVPGQDRYIVFGDRSMGVNNLSLAFVEQGKLRVVSVPQLKLKGAISPELFELVGYFQDSYRLVDSDDLQALLNLFKMIVLEDIRNYNKQTGKYILSNFGSLTYAQTLNDAELDNYIVRYDEKAFDTVEDAKQNALNVLSLLKKKVNARFESEKQNANRIASEQKLASQKLKEEETVASACDELNDF